MLPRSGSILGVEGPLLGQRCFETSKGLPLERYGIDALLIDKKIGSPSRAALLFPAKAARYCAAAGLWCTGAAGFGAVLVRITPFAMIIMNGLGVYDAGSPRKSKLAPSFGISLTPTLSANCSVMSAFFASMSSELPAMRNSVGVVLMIVPVICSALPLIAFQTKS